MVLIGPSRVRDPKNLLGCSIRIKANGNLRTILLLLQYLTKYTVSQFSNDLNWQTCFVFFLLFDDNHEDNLQFVSKKQPSADIKITVVEVVTIPPHE